MEAEISCIECRVCESCVRADGPWWLREGCGKHPLCHCSKHSQHAA